jgi:hypothetical protein
VFRGWRAGDWGPAGVSEEAALIVQSDPDTIRLRRVVVKRKTQDVVVRSVDTPLDVAVLLLMEEWTAGPRAWTNEGSVWTRARVAVERSPPAVDRLWMISHDRTSVRYLARLAPGERWRS